MVRQLAAFFLVVVCGLIFAMAGCSTSPTDSAKPAANAAAREEDEEIQKNLEKLSPEDRQVAMRQKICPVSGEKLGSMGPPYKVTVSGVEVLLCCDGCEAEIKKDPEKYLAKLKAIEKK